MPFPLPKELLIVHGFYIGAATNLEEMIQNLSRWIIFLR